MSSAVDNQEISSAMENQETSSAMDNHGASSAMDNQGTSSTMVNQESTPAIENQENTPANEQDQPDPPSVPERSVERTSPQERTTSSSGFDRPQHTESGQVDHVEHSQPEPESSDPPPTGRTRRRPFYRKTRNCLRESVHVLHLIWVDLLGIALVLIATLLMFMYMPIFQQKRRLFPVQRDPGSKIWSGDRRLSFPPYQKPEKNYMEIRPFADFPGFIVPIMGLTIALPIAVMVAMPVMQIWVRSGWDYLAVLLGYYKTLALTTLIQVGLKRFTGKLRPIFMQACKPDWAHIENNPLVVQGQMWARVGDCRPDGADGFKALYSAMESFPSGHTAESFAAATFFALYLNAKLKAGSDYHADLWKICVIFLPLVVASCIGISLTIDHNHHADDIILSIPIGVLIAMFVYRCHYASLFDYRTNHLYLPWSSSHHSLDRTPQKIVRDITSRFYNSRFQLHNNLTAVAWPRKIMTRDLRKEKSHARFPRNPELDGAHDSSTAEPRPGSPTPVSPSRFRPSPSRGILKRPSSDETDEIELTTPRRRRSPPPTSSAVDGTENDEDDGDDGSVAAFAGLSSHRRPTRTASLHQRREGTIPGLPLQRRALTPGPTMERLSTIAESSPDRRTTTAGPSSSERRRPPTIAGPSSERRHSHAEAGPSSSGHRSMEDSAGASDDPLSASDMV